MGFNNQLSEIQAKHTEMSKGTNREDVLRLIAEGKRPASQEENERPVGEDGKPLEKLQLGSVSTPKHPILPGEMPRSWRRGDQASTSGRRQAEDLARMPSSKQMDWCVQGGLAQAFGPDGPRIAQRASE